MGCLGFFELFQEVIAIAVGMDPLSRLHGEKGSFLRLL